MSATVVATYCSHRAGGDDLLDAMILWRGRPGWFQRRGIGRYGVGGSRTSGASRAGHVSERRDYEGVTIAFEADFDAGTVTIDDAREPIALQHVNAVLVDSVDRAGGRRVARTLRVPARVRLGGDPNLSVISRSPTLRRFLQCDLPMPRASIPQPPVITVCEKLSAKR